MANDRVAVVFTLERSYWLAVGIASYVAAARVFQTGLSGLHVTIIVIQPLLLYWLWRVTRDTSRTASVDRGVLRAARFAGVGGLVYFTSSQGGATGALDNVTGVSGLGATATCAAYSLARIPAQPGLFQPGPRARSLDAMAFIAALWGFVLVVAGSRLVSPDRSLRIDPLTYDYSITTAAIGTLFVLIASALRIRFQRRLELGVQERATAVLALTISTLSVAVPAAALNIAAPDHALPLAVIVSSAACLWGVLTPEPTRVASSLRAAIVVTCLGGPTAVIGAVLARSSQELSGAIALLTSAAAIGVGLLAQRAARPLGPERSRWTDAIRDAANAALVPEPQAAIVATLQALQKTSNHTKARPELWRLDPGAVLRVNVAGYLEENEGQLPPRLTEFAEQEPERTLRWETLKALVLKRPEVRPLLDWFDARGAFSATVVLDQDGPSGCLVLPRGDRRALLALEEARAARKLADRIAALVSLTASIQRARKREAAAMSDAAHWEREHRRISEVLAGEKQKNREFAENLARPLRSVAYSPRMQEALGRVAGLAARERHLTLVAPYGVDSLPWAAQAHLASPNADGPLLFVDGEAETRASADGSRWLSPESSPISLARGGTLFIRAAHLLPSACQIAVAEAIAEQHSVALQPQPSAAKDIPDSGRPRAVAKHTVVVIALNTDVNEAKAAGALELALAAYFGKAEVELPSLHARAEDLRPLILDVLSRIQRRPSAVLESPALQPLGIERRALQLLLDYSWPGNDRELQDLITRASLHCEGRRLSVRDLARASFQPALQVLGAPAPSRLDY